MNKREIFAFDALMERGFTIRRKQIAHELRHRVLGISADLQESLMQLRGGEHDDLIGECEDVVAEILRNLDAMDIPGQQP